MKKEELDGETVGLKATERDVEKNEDHSVGEYNVVFVDGVKGDGDALANRDVKNFQLDQTDSYCGLKKEDLLKYAKDPYWVRLRIVLLVIFVVIWVSMLVAAIVIIVLTPKCPPRPNQEWWETAMIYCIQPKSFLDSDGDGIGDFKGVHSKLEYIKDVLKADAIDLGVIQQSSDKSSLSSDILDFMVIHPKYGSPKDFEDLRTAIHKKGMKLILEFVPNHSSDEHFWFKSSKDKHEAFKEFYLWHPGFNNNNETRPPNNLTDAYGQPAWTFNEDRKEYYYHSYSSHEPDLNLTNVDVIARLDEAIKHWLNLRVDGIKILGVSHLVESRSLFESNVTNPVSMSKTVNLINHWRQLLDNHTNSESQRSQPQVRILLADFDDTPSNLSSLFGQKGLEDMATGPHLPINKQLLRFDQKCKAACLSDLIHGWFDSIGKTSRHSNWMMSDAGNRVTSRIDKGKLLNAVVLLLHTLPGAAFVYYGDEIGMHDFESGGSNTTFSIRPMQWSDQPNAGHSQDNQIVDDFLEVNVESQLAHGSGMSKLKVFSKLASLRKEPSVQSGKFEASSSKNIYYYIRQAEGHPTILVALNLGPASSTVALRKGKLAGSITSTRATILASTYNFNGGRSNLFSDGTEVNLDLSILLHPGEGVVLKWLVERPIF